VGIDGRSVRRRVGAALVAAALAASGAGAETLTDALVSAYNSSNLLEQNRAVLRAADEDVATAIARLRPTLDFQLGVTAPDPDFGLDVMDGARANFALVAEIALLEAGGSRARTIDLQKETVLATREALVAVEQDVLLTAVEAFFQVRRAQALVELRENNVRLIGEELQAARDRFEVGEVTRTDVALAESRLAAARSELAAARGDLEVAREAYRAAVGRYPGALVVPSTLPTTAGSLEAAIAVAVRRHPRIREAQRQVSVAGIAADIATRAYGPSIGLQAQGTYGQNTSPLATDTGFAADQSLSLTFRQPIYRGGRLAALERQAAARRDQSRAALHQTTLTVTQNVGTAWARVAVARAQIRATEQQIRAAEIAFEGTREEARLGARTTLDVLDAEQDLLDARAARIDAVATQYVANYSLLSAMGLLTVDHLDLGVQRYDPEAYYNAVRQAPARLTRQGEALDRVLRGIGRE